MYRLTGPKAGAKSPEEKGPVTRVLQVWGELVNREISLQENSSKMLIPTLVAILAAFASMQLSSLCTTIYLHRAMAHKGLKLHPSVAMLMRIEIWLFTGSSMREWVAVHRKHHHIESFYDVELNGLSFLQAAESVGLDSEEVTKTSSPLWPLEIRPVTERIGRVACRRKFKAPTREPLPAR